MTRALTSLLLALACAACATPGALPTDPVLRGSRLAPIVPDAADRAAADLAVAALVGDAEAAERASLAIARFDAEREEGPTGIAPAAAELWNAAAVPGRAWREASLRLLQRDDLDPAMRERLERSLADDPLVRADARVRDARRNAFARLFNAVAEPVGQSLLSTALAPYRIGRSLVRYGVYLYRRDPLPLQRRQALAHWKEFLARYPDAEEAPRIAAQVEDAQERWHRTMRRHALRDAESALDAKRPRDALVLAERALQHSPEHPRAEAVRAEAATLLERQRAERAESLRFALPPGDTLVQRDTRAHAIALLSGRAPEADLPELRFARAGTLLRDGAERDAHALLSDLADGDPGRDPMARHAQAVLADPMGNPWDTFLRARSRDRSRRALWLWVGPFAETRAPSGADGALIGLIELPRVAQTVVTLPLRLLQWPFARPLSTSKVTAVQARRYLRLHPDGVHADAARAWLQSWLERRDDALGALAIAEQRDPDGDHAALREKAAEQMLRVASREERDDLRRAMLAGVTRRFPDTDAGDAAGRRVREEARDWTPHRVALSRGFLLENPEVTGVRGLDLDPALLDEDGRNGELHPQGLALVGGRVIEVATLPASGDEDDAPERSRVELPPERFARLVARLEETSFRNALLDADDALAQDPQRDLLFERARLGLADDVDARPTARSDYAYRGMRERYGMVRRREPILPFDIVVQGSLEDLSLGAFPRMRSADEPENALLYE